MRDHEIGMRDHEIRMRDHEIGSQHVDPDAMNGKGLCQELVQRLCKALNLEGDLKLPGDIPSQLGKAKDELFHNGMREGGRRPRVTSMDEFMAFVMEQICDARPRNRDARPRQPASHQPASQCI